MSTLEKAIDLLQTIPDDKLETVCTFLQFIKYQEDFMKENEKKYTAFGIANKYANPDLIPLEKEAIANAMLSY